MSKSLNKVLALVLVLVMAMGMAACGGSSAPATTEEPAAEAETAPAAEAPAAEEPAAEVPSYTFNDYSSSLANNWNPHTWETNADSAILGYVAYPFVDYSILDSENGVFQWVFEMADEVNDVTADHQDDLTKYAVNLPEGKEAADITDGYVYEFKLNQSAKWANGEKITADDYIYSMEQLLDPKMHNYRANNYINGEYAYAGAEAYYYGGSTAYLASLGAFPMDALTKNEDGQYVNADGNLMYIALNVALDWTSGNTLKDYVEGYGDAYFDVTNWETLVGMMDDNGVIPLTDENLALFAPVTTGNPNWGETEDDLPNYFAYAKTYPEASFDTVGVYKVDDYTIRVVTQAHITSLNYFYYSIAGDSTWLVYKPLYEAGKDTSGELVTTNYGSSPETTMSYGPYMFESMQADKQMVFVQNPEWYGWQQGEDGTLVSFTDFEVDGAIQQQYRATKIVIDVMDDTAAKQAFLKGELSRWVPTAEDLVNYTSSDELYKTPETYTMRFFFNTNLDALKAMDESKGNTNSVVMSNVNFRKAFSLAIDRDEWVTATEGYIPAYSMLNSLYFYDIFDDPTSSYRNSEEAMKVIVDLYGVEYGEGKAYTTLKEAYDSINGYNLTEAKELMKKACEELVAAGLYKEGEPIYIRVGYKKGAIDSAEQNQITLMNKYLNAAVEGSGFGTVTLEAVGNINDRYGDTTKGEYAIGYGAWGGNAFGPFSMFQVYMDVEYMGGLESIHEGGCWDPSKETLTLNVKGEDVTMTWQDWSRSMIGNGRFASEDNKVKLGILAQLEGKFLELYYCIPLASSAVPEIMSFKNSYFTDEYNIMYNFGLLRLMKFNYTDAEWTEFVASQNGELHYE